MFDVFGDASIRGRYNLLLQGTLGRYLLFDERVPLSFLGFLHSTVSFLGSCILSLRHDDKQDSVPRLYHCSTDVHGVFMLGHGELSMIVICEIGHFYQRIDIVSDLMYKTLK